MNVNEGNRLEHDLQQRVQELAEAEERLRSVVNHVVDGIVTINEHGTVDSCNPAAEKIFGYSASEIIGQNVKMLMPEAIRSEHDGYLVHYLRSGEAKIIGFGREVVGRRKDGTTFPMDLAVSEFQLGQYRYFTGIIRDISERKRAESQFQQAQKMEVVGQLASRLAHDFNNLLAVILGCSELLGDDATLSEDGRELVEEIYKAVGEAAALIRQLLAFSRHHIIQPKVLNLNEVVTETMKMLGRLLSKDIALNTKLPADLWPVKVDAGQMNQVIMNLALNARDAMTDGGTLTIETVNVELDETYVQSHRGVKAGPYVALSISDTGCGMDLTTQDHIFEPFFTTKDADKGTGLGLSTVFTITKQSGGHVTVYSEVGNGTTFKVYLPKDETAPNGTVDWHA